MTLEAPTHQITETDPRVQLATERTLLAWIRTGLALMAFGFVVARFSLILHSLGVQSHRGLTVVSTTIGIILVLLGVVTNAGASAHYRSYFRRLDSPFSAWSLAVWISVASALIGVMLVIYLVLVDLSSWNAAPLPSRPLD